MKKNISKKLYPGLTKAQHSENNRYFERIFPVLNEGGHISLAGINVLLRKGNGSWKIIKKGNAHAC